MKNLELLLSPEPRTSQICNDLELPAAFLARMRALLGEEYEDFIAVYEEEPVHSLRVNTLREGVDPGEFFELKAIPGSRQVYYYPSDQRPGSHPLHEAGAYYIQEASAMFPALHADISPGMRVLDLCAAPGGKSTQLAESLMGKGLLVSNEIIPKRAEILSENIERMGVKNALVTCASPGELAERLPGFFDRILVDAPCSGEGMFRKNPSAIEEWSEENVLMCARRQKDILEQADKMLAWGGRLIYSTCTFSSQENEEQIEGFLKEHPEYEPVRQEGLENGMARIYPHKFRGEGHFAAVLQKGEESSVTGGYKSAGDRLTGEYRRAFMDFRSDIGYAGDDFEGFLLFGKELYAPPDDMISLKGLKALRPGLDLGQLRSGRFIPAHAWAMSLKPGECRSLEIKETREAAAWIRGETLEERTEKGWLLVCFRGCPLGWGKSDGNRIKNHYPKGLRKNL